MSTDSAARDVPDDREELAARLEVLSEENRRLRSEYRRAKQTRHRRTALGLAGIGLVALLGAAILPGSRDVLLALSGTGLFAAVLVRTLTPERFIAASIGKHIYEAYATTGQELVTDLGLTEDRIYVPTGERVRLFVPQHESYTVPDEEALDQTFVVTDDSRRGVALEPTGNGLYQEFEQDLADTPASDPAALGEQLADALTDGFELVDIARPDSESGRLSVAIDGYAYGAVKRFDHPIPSFLAVGVSTVREQPVRVEVSHETDDRAEAIVTCRWDAES